MSDIITNTSYCSKDFGSLYPEVLDLAKRITNEWDPSSSNESDPGVVLLKEAAFIGDHNNFNIDKNTLENFLPTATQDKSVRNIVEMNGYVPQYYVSANGKVSFNYTIPDDSEETAETFVIPAFSLVISDVNEGVTYTQIDDLPIVFDEITQSKKSSTQSCTFIQGTLETLKVNNSSTILVENLDDNNRIYFPEVMIAQNGIYVRYADDSIHKEYGYWENDNYLATRPAGSRLYKVDYDSDKGLPYVEFPADISSIIESGLIINYFTTAGLAGNVNANLLTNIVSPTVVTDRQGVEHDVANFTLTNVSSIMNGKNPETIDEMYRSFKKIVGTFNTLVTREDYADRIMTLNDDLGNSLVSNVFVTDRRNDINNAANIMTADKNGYYLENVSLQKHQLKYYNDEIFSYVPEEGTFEKGTMITVRTGSGTEEEPYKYNLYVNMANSGVRFEEYNTISLNEFSILSDAMTPYDIVIYALKAFSMADYSTSAPYKALETAYVPISADTRKTVESSLSADKCINHVFKTPQENISGDSGDVYCYKNYAPLNITITPYYKITSTVRDDIIDNIYKAISENFNPRTVEWGKELDSLEIKDVILNCDDRIRDVDITPIQYNTKVLKTNYTSKTEVNLTTSAYFVDLIAKNVLAGRVCLFSFDDRFSLNYNQVNGSTYNEIYDLSSQVAIHVNPSVENNFKQEALSSYTNTYEILPTDNVYYKLKNVPNVATVNKGTEVTLKYNSNIAYAPSFAIQFDVAGETIDEDKVQTFTPTLDKSYTISYDAAALTVTTADVYTRLTPPATGSVGKLVIKETIYVRATDDGVENVNYTLHENEAIQIISPNYYSDTTYSTYVNYRYVDTSVSPHTIKAETDYELNGNQSITLIYTKDGVEQQDSLTSGTIVRTSFDLVPTDLASNTSKRTYSDSTGIYKNANFKSLSSSQTISTRKLMKTVLSNTALRCYWNVNNNGVNDLFGSGNTRILDGNEFFVYTNDTMNEMILLGAGTKLVKSANDTNSWIINEAESTSLSDISISGIQNEINWQSINLAGSPLSIIEMNVITLGENDNIRVSGWIWSNNDSEDTFIDNTWKTCNGNIVYTSGSSTTTLPYLENFYSIRSRLDIVCGANNQQKLYSGSEAIDSEGYNAQQTISFKCQGVDGTIYIKGDPNKQVALQLSKDVAVLGGNEIDISYLGEIDAYAYEISKTVPSRFNGSEGSEALYPTLKQTVLIDYNTLADGYVGCTSTSEGDTYHYRAVYQFFYNKAAQNDSRQWIVPIRIDGDDVVVNAKIEVGDTTGIAVNFVDYNVSTTSVAEMRLTGNNLYFLSPTYTTATPVTLYLVLEWDVKSNSLNEAEIINVNDLSVITGENKLISKQFSRQDGLTLSTLLTRIKNIISNSDKPNTKYYYTYNVDEGVHINLDTYCTKSDIDSDSGYSSLAFDNPSIMWDTSNIACDKTIAQVDIRNSTIKIKSGMLKE